MQSIFFSNYKIACAKTFQYWIWLSSPFNPQMEWSQHYLTLLRRRGKLLTAECHLAYLPLIQYTQPYCLLPVYQIFPPLLYKINIEAKSPIHFMNRPTKDWAILSSTPCNCTFRWRSWSIMNLLSLALPESVGQPSGLLGTQAHRTWPRSLPSTSMKAPLYVCHLRSY